ncbi:CHAD domain-containing protein [Microbacterium sp. 2FI]|uniref:CHAD domain-containing protein n=1 Tax=Microbacterium sp. 2FI TaxID=2502193 RepID=UPI0010F91F63|nr:CHAD domain-containing protein [Microbacterium sp. 2FI]
MSSPQPPRIGPVVRSIVDTAAAAVIDTKPAALRDEPDAVHQHRTAVRRLRSVLAGFSPLLDEPSADRLRVMYGEWGTQLGIVRDAEVRAAVAATALQERGVTDESAIWRRLVDEERGEYSRLHARLIDLAAGPRIVEADDLLRGFARDPDVLEGDRKAKKQLRRVLAREVERVDGARRRMDGTDNSFHDVRKAGRRLRYVAEAMTEAAPTILPDAITELAVAGEVVHDVLGDHRDLVIFADRIDRVRSLAARAIEPVQLYDDLARDARADAGTRLDGLDAALDGITDAWKRVRSA